MGLVRERYGPGFGLLTLMAEQLVIVMTIAAQIGGPALVLQFFGGDLEAATAPGNRRPLSR